MKKKRKIRYIAILLWVMAACSAIFTLLTLLFPEAMYNAVPVRPIKARLVEYKPEKTAAVGDDSFVTDTCYSPGSVVGRSARNA